MSRSASSTAGSSSMMKTGPSRKGTSRTLALSGCMAGPAEAEFRSGGAGAGEPQAPAPGFDERAAEHEPEPQPLRLGGVERLEQAVGDIGGNARPVVAHAQLDLVAVGRNLHADMHDPLLALDPRERIEAVAEEVQQHLLDLDRIGG